MTDDASQSPDLSTVALQRDQALNEVAKLKAEVESMQRTLTRLPPLQAFWDKFNAMPLETRTLAEDHKRCTEDVEKLRQQVTHLEQACAEAMRKVRPPEGAPAQEPALITQNAELRDEVDRLKREVFTKEQAIAELMRQRT